MLLTEESPTPDELPVVRESGGQLPIRLGGFVIVEEVDVDGEVVVGVPDVVVGFVVVVGSIVVVGFVVVE